MGKYSDMLLRGAEPPRSPSGGLSPAMDAGMQAAEVPFVTRANVASVDMPEARIIQYAKSRFPDVPLEKAIARYSERDGRIGFMNDNGQWQPEEEPGFLANLTGHSAPIGGGVAGGVAGAAMGAAGGPVGALMGGLIGSFAGGAAGEGVRKGVGHYLGGEAVEPIPLAKSMATEGAWSAAGEVPGWGLNRLFRGKRLIGSLDKLDLNAPEAQRLQRLSGELDVPLTLGEITGDRALINRQSLLRDLPESSVQIEDFLKFRNARVGKAVYSYLDSLSKQTTPDTAYREGARASESLIEGMKKSRTNAVDEFYQMAAPQRANVGELVETLDGMAKDLEGTAAGRSLAKVRRSLMVKEGDELVPKETVGQLHDAKMDLDDLIGAAARKGKRSAVHRLSAVKEQLLSILEDSAPAYRQGRELYMDLSKPINKVENSLVGRMAKMVNDPAPDLSRTLFGNASSPLAVKEARAAIMKYDPSGDTWNSVVRAHIQTTFEDMASSSVDEAGNLGGVFRKKLMGTASRETMLRNALSKQQFQALDDLATVLQATGRAMKGQSTTVPRMRQLAELEREATPTAARAVQPLNVMRRISTFWTDTAAGRYAEQFADVLTDRKTMANLHLQAEALKKLSARDDVFLPTLTQSITLITRGGLQD